MPSNAVLPRTATEAGPNLARLFGSLSVEGFDPQTELTELQVLQEREDRRLNAGLHLLLKLHWDNLLLEKRLYTTLPVHLGWQYDQLLFQLRKEAGKQAACVARQKELEVQLAVLDPSAVTLNGRRIRVLAQADVTE